MNRRKYDRRHLIYYLRVLNEKDELIGYLVDISEGGLMILNETSYPIGKRFTIKIKLPPELEKGDYIMFQAEVKWVKPDINKDYFDIGLEILDKKKKDVEIIDALIEYAGFTK